MASGEELHVMSSAYARAEPIPVLAMVLVAVTIGRVVRL